MHLLSLRQLHLGVSLNSKEHRAFTAGAVISILGLLATAFASFSSLKKWKHRRYLKELGITNGSKNCIGLAVDIGSSSVRCSAYVLRVDRSVTFVSGTLAQIKRDAIEIDGTADAEKVLHDVETSVDECLCRLRAMDLAHLVSVVGFASFVMNLVGVDRSGRPITPVLTYADRHPSTATYARKLRQSMTDRSNDASHLERPFNQPSGGQSSEKETLSGSTAMAMANRYLQLFSEVATTLSKEDGDSDVADDDKGKSKSSSPSRTQGGTAVLHNVTGAPIHTAYAAPQLWRLAVEEAELVNRVSKWQTLVSLCLARWTGATHLPVSFSEASWTGLLDFRALEWSAALTSMLPVPRLSLPDLADYHQGPHGAELAPGYASRWPELSQARFLLGVGDGACANLGSGCGDSGRLAVTIGTSAAARVVIAEEELPPGGEDGNHDRSSLVPPGLWCYRIDRRRLLLGGALTDGGSLLKWISETFRVGPNAVSTESLAGKQQPGGHGLTILPFLSGERAPGWCPNATASILGLTKQTTGADVYRAGMEAVALRLAAIVRLMRPHLGQNLVVGASGTALERSGLWRQILADALGLEVVLEEQGEATSKGVAALMAEWRFEEEPLREAATQEQVLSRHAPHQDAHAAYQEALQRQDALYRALHPPQSGDHATSHVALYNIACM